MAERTHASSKEMIVIGCIAGLAGFYFLLVGAGVLPIPGGPRICTGHYGSCSPPDWRFSLAALPSFFRLSDAQTSKENSLLARHSGCV